jgi:hypothetical protein
MIAFVAGFFAGLACGSMLAIVAFRISSKPSESPTVAYSALSAGVDPLQPFAAYQLREVFKHLENGKA